MADSNTTKKMLAMSFKELTNEMPFSKITVSHICKKSEMNRKSFYYHFKDKHDLVSWIYDTEFLSSAKNKNYEDGFSFLLDICKYLEDNKFFYRKVLEYDGQNSFFEYFERIIFPIIEKCIQTIFKDRENHYFYAEFFSDALITAIKKWLLSAENTSAEQFISLIKSCICGTSKIIFI